MRLITLEIKNLYGGFNETVEFDPALNLLVGINGSGKTTVLNCIDWLLRPDLARLASVPFDSLQLRFEHGGKEHLILAKQDKTKLTFSGDAVGFGGSKPITVDFIKNPHEVSSDSDMAELYSLYKNLTPEPHEKKLWKAIHDLPHPLTISLDRSISAEVEEEVYFEIGTKQRVKKVQKTKSPLEKVIDVTRNRHIEYRRNIFDLNEKLKSRLVMSAFKSPMPSKRPSASTKKITLTEIARLERKVTSLISSSLGLDDGSEIEEYFSRAKQFAKASENDAAFRPIFLSHFKHLDELVAAFDEYEQKSTQAFVSLGSYLRALNSFFIDSKKAIGFNEVDGTLGFKFIDKKGAEAGAYRSVDRLSSGERQIVILLTFLAFVSESDRVFVVDEPELSLHPKWQQNFLGAILSQAPVDTQIILATHSPEIVAKHRDKCIVLGA